MWSAETEIITHMYILCTQNTLRGLSAHPVCLLTECMRKLCTNSSWTAVCSFRRRQRNVLVNLKLLRTEGVCEWNSGSILQTSRWLKRKWGDAGVKRRWLKRHFSTILVFFLVSVASVYGATQSSDDVILLWTCF